MEEQRRKSFSTELNVPAIRAELKEHPWKDHVQVLQCVDSTNLLCKQLARQGAPEGTVLFAEAQTGGRGRLGRSFFSPPGQGIYCSVLLRPTCQAAELTHLTAMSAVAVCNALEKATGLRPKIKWTNDLVFRKQKLCGILTELQLDTQLGKLRSAVIGIGINCNQLPEEIPEELRGMAASVRMATGKPVDRCALAAALVCEIAEMRENLFAGRERYLAQYASDCITIGQRVRIVRYDEESYATALGIDENAALRVRYDDGAEELISTGEVSVRGMYGYL